MANQQVISMGLGLGLGLIVLWAGAAAAQSEDCTNVLISMSPCLNYISGNSTSPSNSCCAQLRTVVGSQPRCLCQVLNGGGSNLGLSINQTQALALPRACNVETPSPSQCNGAASPSGSPKSSPDSPNSGSEGGSKTVPTGDGSSDAATLKMGASVLLGLVFVATFVSTFDMA